ncbi:MAG: hypothetical protein PHX82_13930 [Paracoccaceae bacterium]|nr:hypothetical protein [Paracoccaceae bacterium]
MLETSRIRAGRWEGLVASAVEPKLEVVHLEQVLPGLEVSAQNPGKWRLSLPIPVETLSDGVQTFLLRSVPSAEVLGRFTIVTGVPLEDDIRAEVDLLRAELDLLKKAFRRHCVETEAKAEA